MALAGHDEDAAATVTTTTTDAVTATTDAVTDGATTDVPATTDAATAAAKPKSKSKPKSKPKPKPKSQPKMFTCDVCGITIKHMSNYNRHRRRHDKSPAKAKPHKCGVCGKTFRDKSELGNHLQSGAHMTLATNVQRYTCATCGGCFTSQRALLHHRHSKERTFPCDICQRRFQTAVVCTAHRRRHFWRALPRCRACGATFAAEAHLTRHIRNHESETSEVVRY